MKRQLKTVVNIFTKNNRYLRYYLLQILYSRANERIWLREGEVIEIKYNNITVNFTWEMISAVNCKTNKYIDINTEYDSDDIVEFFESEGLIMPICPLWRMGHCPICDDEWRDMGITYADAQRINRKCCEIHRDLTKKEIKGGK